VEGPREKAMSDSQKKTCPSCGKVFGREVMGPKHRADSAWVRRVYCSKPCATVSTSRKWNGNKDAQAWESRHRSDA
jgi:hypothetical protein